MLDLEEPLTDQEAATLSDRELTEYVAAIWADPDLRAELRGSQGFLLDRLRTYGQRPFLTAAERQGLTRTLFAGPNSVQKRVNSVRRKREHSASEGEGEI